MTADPRFDVRPQPLDAAGRDDVAAWAFSLTRGLRDRGPVAGWHPAAAPAALRPPPCEDYDDAADVQTLATQLDHVPAEEPCNCSMCDGTHRVVNSMGHVRACDYCACGVAP